MITITFYHFSDDKPKGFCVKGHSGYAESGTDIICASVSSAAYLVANTITEILGVKALADIDDGLMKFTIPETAKEKSRDVLLGFELHINELSHQYPDYVKTITEV